MKKVILSVSAFMLTMNLMAQAPQKMSYQAVVRNSSNGLVQNGSIGMRISILQGSASGTAVYVETQTPTTNNNGLASVTIGSGTVVSGDMSTIDWSTGDYFLQTETDPTGGTNYTVTGTSQLLSVPYALHAKTAESVINDQVNDADADPTNELQNWSNLPGIPADFADNTDDVDDADADPTNEIELPSGGNNAQVLSTDGTGNYTWVDQPANELPAGGTNAQVLSTDGAGTYSWVDQTVNNLPNGTAVGQTAYWNGTAWVVNTNVFNNGGNVGIGNASPVGTLDVSGNGVTTPSLVLRNGNDVSTNASSQMAFGYSNSDQYKHFISTRHNGGNTYNNSIDFYTSDGTANGTQGTAILNLSLNGGNVGVGGNFPSEKLDVNGNVKFSGALMPNNTAGTAGQVLTSAGAGSAPTWTTPAAATNIYNSNGTLTGNRVVTQGTNTLGFTGSSVNAFSVDGTTMSVDAQNNRVGIGTAAPTNDLHVAITTLGGGVTVSGPTPGYRLSPNAGASIAFGAANIANEWASGSAANDAVMVNQHATGKLILATGSAATARMTVTPAGNVGIGTTAPSGALHVNGANGASSWTYIQGNTGAGGAGNPSASITTGLMMGWNATNIGGESEIIFGSGGGSDPKLNFATWNGTTKTQIMSMNDNGNVGIGTINPNAPLQFANTLANRKVVLWEDANNDNQFYGIGVNGSLMRYQTNGVNGHAFFAGVNATTSNELMRITSAGNVGIGTSTPNGKLAVGSAIGAALIFQPVATISENSAEILGLQGSTVGTNINFYKNGSTARQAIIQTIVNSSGSDLSFRTTSTAGVADQQRVVIKADGNVGVGTATPARTLHVNAVMRLEPTTAPATPAKGDIYMDSTTNKLMVFDGTVWQACW